jgi:hypothetical protein
MGGGLIQLVAYGSQDIYLTSQPQVTFFKAIYKRHTHFAIESIPQAYDGVTDFGDTVVLVLARNGDLIGNVTIEAQLPNAALFDPGEGQYSTFGWMQGVGNYLISRTAIFIGGQKIDELYGIWLDIWSELTLNGSQLEGFGKMIGKDYSTGVYTPYDITQSPGNRLFIPLQFWFCKNPGLAIPLIALQYHEIKLEINIEKYDNLLFATNGDTYSKVFLKNPLEPPRLISFKVYAEYYFLDSTERRKFTQNAHEYLIEQTQSQAGNMQSIVSENILRLNLNHPTKELIFIFGRNNSNAPQNDFSLGNNKIPNGTPAQFAPVYNLKLLINGHDRFRERPGEYFRLVQPYQHHTRIPSNYIYSYSFALRPEEHQPSGTCNFTRIDNAHMVVNFRNKNVIPGNQDSIPEENYSFIPNYLIIAPSYNIFRVLGGMGGLAYSN